MKTVKKSELILNIGLVILTVIGVILMFNGKPGEGVLQASGLANLNTTLCLPIRVISNKRADG